MADEKKPIDSVTTFVAELPGLPLEESLKKFQGRRTLRTIAAARRIASRKQKIKLPRNLLRQLFRLGGGFKMEGIKLSTEKPSGKELRSIQIGDMEVVCGNQYEGYPPNIWIHFRGQMVAKMGYDSWTSREMAKDLASLGVPYTPNK